MDIVGRFMLQVQNFEGIRSAIELEEVMGYLDDPEISEYPIGSGCSCTQFFVPHAYASGWRLKDHAADLWAAFEQCAVNAGDTALAGGISVGMAWVRLAFVYVMQQLMLADDHMITIPSDLWQEAGERSTNCFVRRPAPGPARLCFSGVHRY